MRKLELKDIVGYLPYDLQVYNEQQDSKIDTIIGIFKGTFDFEYWSPLNSDIENYKPILHPISDLTKPIKVDGYNEGKEFTPLVALARTAYSELYDEYLLIKKNTIQIEENPKSDGSYQIGGFSYKNGMFEMLDYGEVIKRNKNDLEPFVEIIHTPLNQCKYFDLLNQWHFDYRNLIEDGLAVDINTINNILNKKNYD
jgi:hypothetical protein